MKARAREMKEKLKDKVSNARNYFKRRGADLVTNKMQMPSPSLREPLLDMNEKAERLNPLVREGELRNMNDKSESDGTDNAEHFDRYDYVLICDNPYSKKQEDEEENEEKGDDDGNKGVGNMSSVFSLQADVKDKPESMAHTEIISRIRGAGLITYCYFTLDSEEIVIKIAIPKKLLLERAEDSSFAARLDEGFLEKRDAQTGHPIADDRKICHYSPYELIYTAYQRDELVFKNPEGLSHPFNTCDRVRMILSILESRTDGEIGADLKLDEMIADGSLNHHFALHESDKRESLRRIWMPWKYPWQQPVEEVRNYFGEQLGVYYVFIIHFSTWLVWLMIGSVVAVALWLLGIWYFQNGAKAAQQNPPALLYSTFVCLWAQGLIEYWKRKQITTAMEWGQTEFEEVQEDRLGFQGEKRISLIDGREEVYFPQKEKQKRVNSTWIRIGGIILLLLVNVTVIFTLQNVLSKGQGAIFAILAAAVGIIQSVEIQLFEYLYKKYAIERNNFENYRTQTEWEDALIVKYFVFNFVNSFGSLYFVAFAKDKFFGCTYNSCMLELAQTLFTVFATKILITKAVAFITNYKYRIDNDEREKQDREDARARGELLHEGPPSQAEEERNCKSIDSNEGVLNFYNEVFINYGFVTLFAVAGPFSSVMAYINNQVDMRINLYSQLYIFRRINPQGGEDIGAWEDILQLCSYAAVITNAGIVAFTMDVFDFLDQYLRVFYFVIFQYVIVSAMGIFAYIVDDIPESVQIQLERQEHLHLVIKGEEDEESDSRSESSDAVAHREAQERARNEPLKIFNYDENFDPDNYLEQQVNDGDN